MNKKHLFITVFTTILLLVSAISSQNTEATKSKNKIEIATDPPSSFINAFDMAPGDKITSPLKVKNEGNVDFDYVISSRMQSGDELFYDKLVVSVYDIDGLLFRGNLDDLKLYPIGNINKFNHQNFSFEVEFPLDSGNEYQGKKSVVAFDFIAYSPTGDECDCFKPPFSNLLFNYQLGTTVPIKFDLLNMKNVNLKDVRLEITGPGPNNTNLKYEYTISEGNLEKKGNHFQTNFDSDEYPLIKNGKYQATVYVGNKIVCKRYFWAYENANRSNSSVQ
jgi:hypothetical protein